MNQVALQLDDEIFPYSIMREDSGYLQNATINIRFNELCPHKRAPTVDQHYTLHLFVERLFRQSRS